VKPRLLDLFCGAVQPCWHRLPPAYVYGHGADLQHARRYGKTSVSDWKHLMGIDWMTRDELAQAIPPTYTELIGAQLLAHVRARQAA
jgi:DNA (cytosine-5)-methyltransferase 1